jgi:hypothetical protein
MFAKGRRLVARWTAWPPARAARAAEPTAPPERLGARQGLDGICANVAFPFPQQAVGDLVRACTGQPLRGDDPWLPERLVWSVLEVLPGLFGHPGLTWSRVITSMSVEMTTGVFSQLPQLALILIGSFMLVLSLLQAFGCIDSLLKVASRIAGLSPQALPQAAVVGSLSEAAVSRSTAAKAITTGSATIPAMIGSGMPRVTAAAIETAASLGGQLGALVEQPLSLIHKSDPTRNKKMTKD